MLRHGRHLEKASLTLNFAHMYTIYIHSSEIRDTPDTPRILLSHKNPELDKFSTCLNKENGTHLLQISHLENACTIKTKILLHRFFFIKLLLTISNGNKLLLKDK